MEEPYADREQNLNSLNTLTKASVVNHYLYSNSTVHTFIFGAMAELVDNAKDANAKNLEINYEYHGENLYPCITFLDDGCGMTTEECRSIVRFGHSGRKENMIQIGRYGNGLKAGSMKIAESCLVLTKRENIYTALFISEHLTEKGTDQIHVSCPAFEVETLREILRDEHDLPYHYIEMDAITKNSPFKNINVLKDQFERITGPCGTLIILFHLRKNELTNLDLISDSTDIRNSGDTSSAEPKSLKEYLSVLYYHPTMKIKLREQIVISRRVVSELYEPVTYMFDTKNMKGAKEMEKKKLETEKIFLEDQLTQANSDHGMIAKEFNAANSAQVLAQRKAQMRIGILRDAIKGIEQQLAALKSIKPVRKKTYRCQLTNGYQGRREMISLSIGLNIQDRSKYGVLFYNNGRLIEMYAPVQCQKRKREKGSIQDVVDYLGILCVVDIPYSVMIPMANKQGFISHCDRNVLLRGINNHILYYNTKVVEPLTQNEGLEGMWREFGYTDMNPDEQRPLTDNVLKSIHKKTDHVILCQRCFKWRRVPYDSHLFRFDILMRWECHMHSKSYERDCRKPESTNIDPKKKGTLPKDWKNEIRRQKNEEDDEEIEIPVNQKKLNERSRMESRTMEDKVSPQKSGKRLKSKDEPSIERKKITAIDMETPGTSRLSSDTKPLTTLNSECTVDNLMDFGGYYDEGIKRQRIPIRSKDRPLIGNRKSRENEVEPPLKSETIIRVSAISNGQRTTVKPIDNEPIILSSDDSMDEGENNNKQIKHPQKGNSKSSTTPKIKHHLYKREDIEPSMKDVPQRLRTKTKRSYMESMKRLEDDMKHCQKIREEKRADSSVTLETIDRSLVLGNYQKKSMKGARETQSSVDKEKPISLKRQRRFPDDYESILVDYGYATGPLRQSSSLLETGHEEEELNQQSLVARRRTRSQMAKEKERNEGKQWHIKLESSDKEEDVEKMKNDKDLTTPNELNDILTDCHKKPKKFISDFRIMLEFMEKTNSTPHKVNKECLKEGVKCFRKLIECMQDSNK